MLARVLSGAIVGLEGALIEVEVDVANRGFPTFTIVGLPDKAVDEAKDRVRTAVVNSEFEMPESRITVNLAPADIPKSGAAFDLPISIGILAASGMISKDALNDSLFIGELSLEGNVRQVPGIISLAIMACQRGIKQIFLPVANAPEAALFHELTIFPLHQLKDLVLHLNQAKAIEPYPHLDPKDIRPRQSTYADFAEIKGQLQAKRALEIAAAGFHNVHLKGVPGAGKTMLSRAFPSILPELTQPEMIEVSQIYSVSGMLTDKTLMTERPFRSPHHTTSRNGLIGGGSTITPGEITLAHRGVLFLDELPEFPRYVLESLRQPLEDGHVTISRATGSLTFPSRFILLAASNPCPCGFLGHPRRPCSCSSFVIAKYRKRLSGPLLDRIDLHIVVPPVAESDLLVSQSDGESSAAIRQRVSQAQRKQQARFQKKRIRFNSEMTTPDIKKFCQLSPEALQLLKDAVARLNLSARSYFKCIKVAQTIADLAGKDNIDITCVAEALQYRPHDE